MNRLPKMGLGSVQWGLAYGIANRQGITSRHTVKEILAEAQAKGITVLDTAALYGDSESVLGANSLNTFRIVTKTPRFGTDSISASQAVHLTNTFHQSLSHLSCPRVYGLLVHHADDLFVPGGEKLIAAMEELKERGLVERIGVSVYDGVQIDALLKRFNPDIVQLPINVIDQRLLVGGQLERLKAGGTEIHARSVFLQGLLLMALGEIPVYFDPIRPLLTRWHSAAEAQGMSLAQAALSFVRDISYVDTVLVGVENLDQFRSCCADFAVAAKFDASGLACHDPLFVNPALWKLS